MRLFALVLSVFCAQLGLAQLVVTDPAFPTQSDLVTITYDATLGNGELQGVFPVYMHTGVITTASTSPSDWQNVVGNWGTDDAQVLMTPLGGNLHSFSYPSSLEDFYGLSDGEEILQLAFVFRNVNGTAVGRAADGSDIFVDVFAEGFSAAFTSPTAEAVILNINDELTLTGSASETATLTLLENGLEVAGNSGTELSYTFTAATSGEYAFSFIANDGLTEISDELNIIVQPENTVANPPAGTEDGISYLSDTEVRLQLHAPNKAFVYVLGDFNNWEFDLNYLMNQSEDGERFWIDIEGLTSGQEYRFQYHIDQEGLRIADIYADKILDKWNDPWIPEESYPNLIEYPLEFTNEPVSVLQTAQAPFNWTDSSYERPAKENLVIYELLLRDFVEARNWETLTDSLDYLEDLGVSAIQMMPVNEFEGNNSWGYNPSFYFAPDKFYGTKDAYKAFVNECHNRGMAVIMDIALNHSFGQNPQVRMYFDPSVGDFGAPTAESPWFNTTPKHDFNVGYDYDHESPDTRAFTKRVLEYWVEEFHIDGYRLDLSKGFTQNNTLGNIGAWNAYDQSRINILNDYANHVWSVEDETYMILEHFANNDEEQTLAAQGFMLWGNMNHEYSEGTMGYSSDFSWISHQQRGFAAPHLIGYMESHDEERLMYKNLQFANSNGDYDITEEATGLARMEMASTFVYTVPGPKMIWQFGELGYDYPINYCEDGTIDENCRTAPKPIEWGFFEETGRKRLYDISAAILALKKDYPSFSTEDFDIDLDGTGKRIHLNHPEMNVVIVGNFDVSPIEMIPGFQQTGTWHDYFSGTSFVEENLNNAFLYQPGEYHIYTDVELPTPDITESVDELTNSAIAFEIFPNPTSGQFQIAGNWSAETQLELLDLTGKLVWSRSLNSRGNSSQLVALPEGLSNGVYLVRISSKEATSTQKISLER